MEDGKDLEWISSGFGHVQNTIVSKKVTSSHSMHDFVLSLYLNQNMPYIQII